MDRTELLESAIKRFEEIFQTSRDRLSAFNLAISTHLQLENHFRIALGGTGTGSQKFFEIMDDIHKTVVLSEGQGLFRGSKSSVLREAILMKLLGLKKSPSQSGGYCEAPDLTDAEKKTRDRVFQEYCKIYDKLPDDIEFSDVLTDANPKSWLPGAPSAKRFCRLTGFDEFFAGEITERSLVHYDKLPWVVYPPMRPYQESISGLMKDVLESKDPEKRQGIMVMPTGAGKTRVAVESLLRWYLTRTEAPLIVWLCHRNELCDQASGSFQSVWNRISIDGTKNSNGRSLRVYRFWNNIWIKEDDGQQVNRIDRSKGGVAILSIQTLQRITNENTRHHTAARERLMKPECIIVDEVHRFETKGYMDALSGIGVNVNLKKDFEETRIGLTATPWRSDPDQQRKMYARWGNQFLLEDLVGKVSKPNDVEKALNDLRKELQDKGILAKPNYYTLPLPVSTTRIQTDQFNTITPNESQKLANNRGRNLRILATIEWLIKERERKSILVFGMTTEHSKLLSVELNTRHITSASVDADTPTGERRSTIAKFRSGELRVLCNHSIFTTGFDAPLTDAIVICRPIRSKTLLDQIFGRGLRGTEFGGTKDCDILVPDYKFKFTNGLTKKLQTYAVPKEEIEKILATKVKQVPLKGQ